MIRKVNPRVGMFSALQITDYLLEIEGLPQIKVFLDPRYKGTIEILPPPKPPCGPQTRQISFVYRGRREFCPVGWWIVKDRDTEDLRMYDAKEFVKIYYEYGVAEEQLSRLANYLLRYYPWVISEDIGCIDTVISLLTRIKALDAAGRFPGGRIMPALMESHRSECLMDITSLRANEQVSECRPLIRTADRVDKYGMFRCGQCGELYKHVHTCVKHDPTHLHIHDEMAADFYMKPIEAREPIATIITAAPREVINGLKVHGYEFDVLPGSISEPVTSLNPEEEKIHLCPDCREEMEPGHTCNPKSEAK